LRERLASPEGQRLLDELATVFAQAALNRLHREVAAQIADNDGASIEDSTLSRIVL
jgi:hypothetical protein